MYTWSGDKKYISSDIFPSGVFSGFGSKLLGDGRNKDTLETFLKEIHIKFDSVIRPSQFHSTVIKEVSKGYDDYRCDGIVTNKNNTVLSVITADCSPIVYADTKNHIIGISHQGWKGTLEKLPGLMIEKMISLGSKKEDIYCAFGPSINDCCYEIYGERLQKFRSVFGDDVIKAINVNQYLNISECNYKTLIQTGLKTSQIDYLPFCTSCDTDRFWSYHRDGDIVGEMVSFVMLI